MPYVSESQTQRRIDQQISKNGSKSTTSSKSGKAKTQFGYRSGPLPIEAQRALEKSSLSTANRLAYLDEVGFQYSLRANREFLVHDRVYTSSDYRPGRYRYIGRMHQGSTKYNFDVTGAIAIESVNTSSIFPAMPPRAQLESMAADMMRQAVPDPTSVAIYQSFGELRDLPQLRRGLSLYGMSPWSFAKVFGEGTASAAGFLRGGKKATKKQAENFLTWVFGVKPMLGDIQKIGDTIIRSDNGLRRISDQATGRTRSRTGRYSVLWQDNSGGESNLRYSNGQLPLTQPTVGPASVRFNYLQLGGTGSSFNVLAPRVQWAWTGVRTLKQFSTWEFFIPAPEKLNSRLDFYRKKAQALQGEGFSSSLVYDLTAYSWLVDWFFDVGGILHYQEALNRNGVVALSNGWSVFDRLTFRVGFYGHNYDASGVSSPYILDSYDSVGATSVFSYLRHERRAGSPYSIGPTWSFTPQQWSILGALGISKGLS